MASVRRCKDDALDGPLARAAEGDNTNSASDSRGFCEGLVAPGIRHRRLRSRTRVAQVPASHPLPPSIVPPAGAQYLAARIRARRPPLGWRRRTAPC